MKIRKLVLSIIWLILLVVTVALPTTVGFAQSSSSVPFTVDFSQVTVNAAKQATYTQQIDSIYATVQGFTRGTSHFSTVVIDTPNGTTSECGGNADACYVASKSTLYISSNAFGSTSYYQAVVAHEMLHSYVTSGNGGRLSDASENGLAWEEMLVEYFALKLYPAPTDTGYDWLEQFMPKISQILSAAGQSNPDTTLANSLFSGNLTDLNAIVGPYLTQPDFLAGLGQYMSTDPNKTNSSGADSYLNAVLQKVQSGSSTKTSGSSGDSGATKTSGSGGQTSTGGNTATNTSGSLFSLSGAFLYPPCLRGDTRNADLGCVSESIAYYTQALLVVIAMGSFFYILYGAFLYTTAYGDENKVKQAKKAIQYAIVGLIIALLASLVVQLVKSTLNA